jgi:transcriptional regulator with XRE-family HTH domain
MMKEKMEIGLRIARFRTLRGLSQEALGEMLGVSRQSVSKWELGQTLPDIEKIIAISKLWGISTDELLLDTPPKLLEPSKHILNWGIYLIVKNVEKSTRFYEQLLERKATIVGAGRFVQFRFNGNCILSIMNEEHLKANQLPKPQEHKFALNLWTTDLNKEFQRVKALKIGPFTDISSYHPTYHFFNLVDPDYNLIEITGYPLTDPMLAR